MRSNVPIIVAALILCLMGCKVSTPGSVERTLITGAKHNFTVHGDEAKNPHTVTPQEVVAGREAFSHYCVSCHGLDGQNTGVPFAAKMSPPVPSLKSSDVQSYSDGQLKWIIDNGVAPSGMPASKGILSDDEIWSIVVYLRHLPPEGSLGEPCFYTGECVTPPPSLESTGISQGTAGKGRPAAQGGSSIAR